MMIYNKKNEIENKIQDNGFDEMLTPKDIQNHLKLGKNKTYELINISSFPKIRIGNTFRIPKKKYLEWLNKNIRKTIYL